MTARSAKFDQIYCEGSSKILTFLHGTIDRNSSLTILRGHTHVLRLIWLYCCSEWWSLHIRPFKIEDSESNIPDLTFDEASRFRTIWQFEDLQRFAGAPLAIVQKSVEFPSRGSEPLYVNMMPFDINAAENTLPPYLHQYLPMIEECRMRLRKCIVPIHDRAYEVRYENSSKPLIAYITVDERYVNSGESHRRGGLHVESPGAVRPKDIADKSRSYVDFTFYHPWGFGALAGNYLDGGIFLASNVANTTKVWNCRVHDVCGDIVGNHGSAERLRFCLENDPQYESKTLEAGELVWITDRTPHESLPVKVGTNRQFFRLVVGEIGFWFRDHSTENPLYSVPKTVPIISGNKFTKMTRETYWECGDHAQIAAAKKRLELIDNLSNFGLGCMVDELHKIGIFTYEVLLERKQEFRDLILPFEQDTTNETYLSATRTFRLLRFDMFLEHMRWLRG